MPSRSGTVLVQKIGEMLGRALTGDEVMRCEELVLNAFTGQLMSHLCGQARRPMKHTFELLHAQLLRIAATRAQRSIRQHELSGALLDTYKKMVAHNPAMSDSEMQSMTVLADGYTQAEIMRGIAIAEGRKVRSVQYVLAVCKAHAGKPTARAKTPIKLFTDDVIRPDPKAVESTWIDGMSDAQDRLAINDAERAANEAIDER